MNEGACLPAAFGPVTDPSSGNPAADAKAGFHYAFALSQSALNLYSYAGDGTHFAAGTSNSAVFGFPEEGSYTIYGRVFDKDNGHSDSTVAVVVNDVAVSVSSGPNFTKA